MTVTLGDNIDVYVYFIHCDKNGDVISMNKQKIFIGDILGIDCTKEYYLIKKVSYKPTGNYVFSKNLYGSTIIQQEKDIEISYDGSIWLYKVKVTKRFKNWWENKGYKDNDNGSYYVFAIDGITANLIREYRTLKHDYFQQSLYVTIDNIIKNEAKIKELRELNETIFLSYKNGIEKQIMSCEEYLKSLTIFKFKEKSYYKKLIKELKIKLNSTNIPEISMNNDKIENIQKYVKELHDENLLFLDDNNFYFNKKAFSLEPYLFS